MKFPAIVIGSFTAGVLLTGAVGFQEPDTVYKIETESALPVCVPSIDDVVQGFSLEIPPVPAYVQPILDTEAVEPVSPPESLAETKNKTVEFKTTIYLTTTVDGIVSLYANAVYETTLGDLETRRILRDVIIKTTGEVDGLYTLEEATTSTFDKTFYEVVAGHLEGTGVVYKNSL